MNRMIMIITNLINHPILKIIAEGENTHLVDHVKFPSSKTEFFFEKLSTKKQGVKNKSSDTKLFSIFIVKCSETKSIQLMIAKYSPKSL